MEARRKGSTGAVAESASLLSARELGKQDFVN